MGISESKSLSRFNSTQSLGSSNHNEVKTLKDTIFDVRRLVDSSSEIRQQYDSYYEILTQNSQKICEIRNNLKVKSSDYKTCTDILIEINDCINLLDEKRSPSESNLDVGADVSTTTSIIRIDLPSPTNNEPIKSLSEMESRMNKIDSDIRKSFEINEFNTLTFLEKKIKILYHDLDMYNARPFSQEQERKKKMSQRLVKFHNKIRSIKRSSQFLSFSQEDGATISRPSRSTSHENLKMIMDIEQELNDDEVVVLTFEYSKDDKKFEELNQKLRNKYIKLDNITMDSKDNKGRVENAKQLTKKILHELNKKGNENEGIIKRNIAEIGSIENNVGKIRKKVENFKGVKGDVEFTNLNYELTSCKDKLNYIKSDLQKIRERKEKVIFEINKLLKLLNQEDVSEIDDIAVSTNEFKELNKKGKVDSSNKENRQSIFIINKIINSLQYFEEEIEHFKGTLDSPKFYELQQTLSDHKDVLENSNDTVFEDVDTKPNIITYINKLKFKLTQTANSNPNDLQQIEELKDIVRNVRTIKSRIDCFNGFYKDDKYTDIENEIHLQLLNLNKLNSESNKIRENKLQTQVSLQKYFKELEDKSLKEENYPNKQLFHKIDNDIIQIKNEIDLFIGGTKGDEDYYRILGRIFASDEEVSSLNEVDQSKKLNYQKHLRILKHNFDQITSKPLPVDNSNLIDENFTRIEAIVSTMNILEEDIKNFKGKKTDDSYVELNANLVNLMIELDEIDSIRIPSITQKRRELLTSFNRNAALLEEKSRELALSYDQHLGIRSEINTIDKNINYSNQTPHEEYFKEIGEISMEYAVSEEESFLDKNEEQMEYRRPKNDLAKEIKNQLNEEQNEFIEGVNSTTSNNDKIVNLPTKEDNIYPRKEDFYSNLDKNEEQIEYRNPMNEFSKKIKNQLNEEQDEFIEGVNNIGNDEDNIEDRRTKKDNIHPREEHDCFNLVLEKNEEQIEYTNPKNDFSKKMKTQLNKEQNEYIEEVNNETCNKNKIKDISTKENKIHPREEDDYLNLETSIPHTHPNKSTIRNIKTAGQYFKRNDIYLLDQHNKHISAKREDVLDKNQNINIDFPQSSSVRVSSISENLSQEEVDFSIDLGDIDEEDFDNFWFNKGLYLQENDIETD